MDIQILQVGPIGTNCYLLCDETEKLCAVVDPGGDAARVAAAVVDTGCAPCAILLTHGHYDHTGGVAELRAKWPDVPVYLNHRDQYEGDAYLQQLFPPVPGAKDYDEGDTIQVGGLTVDVMATPGHSEGSVTLRCGDVLLCEGGAGVPFSEEEAKKVLVESEIQILVDLNSGKESATAWGCDLTYEYVKINGDYRT